MGRILTRRYASLFERNGTVNPLRFARDIYRYGKARELSSFIIWEMFHKLGLFPEEKYLRFNSDEPLRLENERIGDIAFDEKTDRFFQQKGLGVVRSNHNWKLVRFCQKDEIIVSLCFVCIF